VSSRGGCANGIPLHVDAVCPVCRLPQRVSLVDSKNRQVKNQEQNREIERNLTPTRTFCGKFFSCQHTPSLFLRATTHDKPCLSRLFSLQTASLALRRVFLKLRGIMLSAGEFSAASSDCLGRTGIMSEGDEWLSLRSEWKASFERWQVPMSLRPCEGRIGLSFPGH
jgi:hypothetical protein